MEKQILKLLWNCKESPISKTILKKNRVEEFIIPDFKSHHKAKGTKTVWYQYNKRHVEPWTRTENPEVNLYIPSQLISGKDAKTI